MQSPQAVSRGTVLALVTGVVLLAGCGGGGLGDFQATVNKICRDFSSQTKSLDPTKPSDVQALSTAVDQANARLRAVKANSDVRKKYGNVYTEFVSNFNQQALLLGAAIGFLRKGDQQGAQRAIGQVDQLNQKSIALARQMGLKDCQK